MQTAVTYWAVDNKSCPSYSKVVIAVWEGFCRSLLGRGLSRKRGKEKGTQSEIKSC